MPESVPRPSADIGEGNLVDINVRCPTPHRNGGEKENQSEISNQIDYFNIRLNTVIKALNHSRLSADTRGNNTTHAHCVGSVHLYSLPVELSVWSPSC